MPEGEISTDGQTQNTKQDATSTNSINEAERRQAFRTLRWQTLEQARNDTSNRIQTNPTPTETEIAIGAFIEQLEPQVREAVLAFHRKGYSSNSSGFYGDSHDMQGIDGWFTLDQETKAKLGAIGVEVAPVTTDQPEAEDEPHNPIFNNPLYNMLEFRSKEPNLETIKKQWDEVIAILPDTGNPAPPANSYGAH